MYKTFFAKYLGKLNCHYYLNVVGATVGSWAPKLSVIVTFHSELKSIMANVVSFSTHTTGGNNEKETVNYQMISGLSE